MIKLFNKIIKKFLSKEILTCSIKINPSISYKIHCIPKKNDYKGDANYIHSVLFQQRKSTRGLTLEQLSDLYKKRYYLDTTDKTGSGLGIIRYLQVDLSPDQLTAIEKILRKEKHPDFVAIISLEKMVTLMWMSIVISSISVFFAEFGVLYK